MKRYDFKDPNDFKILERMAYDCMLDIDNFPPAAYRYFDKLRTLYAEFKYNALPLETAQLRKRSIYKEYTDAIETFDKCRSVYAAYQEAIHKSELLMSDIEKSCDAEEIAMKACEAVSLMTGDSGFAKRQIRKFKGERV